MIILEQISTVLDSVAVHVDEGNFVRFQRDVSHRNAREVSVRWTNEERIESCVSSTNDRQESMPTNHILENVVQNFGNESFDQWLIEIDLVRRRINLEEFHRYCHANRHCVERELIVED